MARVIVVTSGKGGVGKSTLTAEIGTCLAKRGASVLLIDADVGLNNLDVLLGVDECIRYDMLDVISGRCRIKQAIVPSNDVNNLFILPSRNAYMSEDIATKSFRELINKLREAFDFILIDCPAGIEYGFHRAVAPCDEAIVVTTPHVSSLRDADKVLSILSNYNLNRVELVLNRVRGDMIMNGDMISPSDTAKLLRCNILGVVPEDDNIHIYSELGRLYKNDYKSGISCMTIADNIITGKRRIYDPTSEYRGMVGKIKLFMKRA